MSALFWAERDFRKVLEAIPDAIAIVRGKELLFTNRAFELLDAPGLPLTVGLHHYKKKDGAAVYYEITSGELSNFKGEPAVVLTIRNVTAQRGLDARLRLTDRMVAVGTLAAGAAHEINNPLAYLLANLTFLEEGLGALASNDPRAAELAVALGDAKDGARRIEKIVRDLRTFSATRDSGVDRGDVVRAVQATISLLARTLESHARLHVDIAPVPEVKLGESRLSHVLSGLLSNAKDAFAAPDPKNEIRVRVYAGDNAWVRIEVRDNGRGMGRDVLERIFDPFFTTKDVGGGAGLGLFVAHNLIAGAGGTLTVESQLNEGSRFLISLPVAPKVSPGEFPMPILSTRPRILLAEPDRNVANAMRRLLSEYEVVVASTGAEVVEKCLREPFDVALIEVALPDLSAAELQKRISDRRSHRPARVRFMSQGATATMDLALSAQLGDAPLEKPFDVRKVVASMLSKKT